MDTSAWIEYFLDTQNAEKIENILEKEEIITPSIVLIELSCKAEKEKWDFKKILIFLKLKSSILNIDEEIIINCGKIYTNERKEKSGFSMSDAIILASSIQMKSKILTKDNHFRDKNSIMLE